MYRYARTYVHTAHTHTHTHQKNSLSIERKQMKFIENMKILSRIHDPIRCNSRLLLFVQHDKSARKMTKENTMKKTHTHTGKNGLSSQRLVRLLSSEFMESQGYRVHVTSYLLRVDRTSMCLGVRCMSLISQDAQVDVEQRMVG